MAGIVGLVITWFTFRRAKSAKEAAENAARLAHANIQFFDSISQLSIAIAGMEEIKRHYHTKAWPIVADRCSTLRNQLIIIRAGNARLSDAQQTTLQKAIANLRDAERKIDSARDPDKIKIPKLPELISDDLEQLLSLLIELRKTASGDKHGNQ